MSPHPPLDVAAERARTPGAATAHHFNAAGSALPTRAVLAAVAQHLHEESVHGGYEAAAAAAPRLEGVYDLAAQVLGAHRDEIALLESATAGWQRAVDALDLGRGDRVLATASSYVSTALHLLALEQRRGVGVEVLPTGADGATDLDALEAALGRGGVRLVTAAHVPTSSGLVEPAAAIGALCRAHGVPFLLDATQSVGQLVVDVDELGCDLLVTTGRKFLRAPRGTGLLYVRSSLLGALVPPAPDVRGARWTGDRAWELEPRARRFELWEASHALRLGLGEALADVLAHGVDALAAELGARGHELRTALAALPGVEVADPAAAGGAIVTFTVPGRAPSDVVVALRERGVRAFAIPDSHGRWDMAPRGLTGVVRAAGHVYTDDVDRAALLAAVATTTPHSRPTPRPVPSHPVPPALLARRAGADPVPPARPARRAGAGAGAGAGRGVDADVVVVGLGVHGSAAARALAQRGLSVIGLEQYRLGHDRGSSHGSSRMIRRAYPHPVWDDLVDRAYAGWRALAEETGEHLVTTTGGLYARSGPSGGALRGPGCREVDAATAARIAPALHLPDGWTAVHDPAAGIVHADAALAALRASARAHGADLRDASPVLGLRHEGGPASADPLGGGVVTVQTPSGPIRARRVVLATGAWTGRLLPQLAPSLRVVRIVNAHLAADPDGPLGAHGLTRGGAATGGLGCYSMELPEGLAYGFPALDGRGIKIGLDTDVVGRAGPRKAAPTAEEVDQLVDIARRFLPGAGAVTETISCLYTMTPDRRFVIGAAPGSPGVVVASACSGHGFKFGPAVGEAVADLLTGVDRPDLAVFDPSRWDDAPPAAPAAPAAPPSPASAPPLPSRAALPSPSGPPAPAAATARSTP